MIAKGKRTAAPVASTTATRSQLRCCAWLLGANGLLPLLEELEPLGLIQVDEERGAHRDWLEALPIAFSSAAAVVSPCTSWRMEKRNALFPMISCPLPESR